MTADRVPLRNRSPFGWWVAAYVQRFELKTDRPTTTRTRCLAWENTILVRAKTRELAYRKAVAVAKRNSNPRWRRYGDPPGRLGRWVYEGLTSLLPVYDRLGDGAELFWSENRRTTVGAVRRRVKRKEMLEAFRDQE